MNFNYEMDSIADDFAKTEPQAKYKRMSLKQEVSHVVLLPAVGKGKFIFQTCVHEMWKDGKVSLRVASPSFEKEPDPIMDFGFKLKEKYKNSSSKKLKELYKQFLPKRDRYVNVIDLEDIKAGPKVLRLPHDVYKVIKAEYEEAEDFREYIGPDAKILKIKHNGGEKLDKEYTLVKFLDKKANLVESGKLELDDIVSNVYNLEQLQPANDTKAVEKLLAMLKLKAKHVIESVGDGGIEDDGVETKKEKLAEEDFDLD